MDAKTLAEKILAKRKKPAVERELTLDEIEGIEADEPVELPQEAPKSRKELVAEIIKQKRGY
jgi:hypothetical protein